MNYDTFFTQIRAGEMQQFITIVHMRKDSKLHIKTLQVITLHINVECLFIISETCLFSTLKHKMALEADMALDKI